MALIPEFWQITLPLMITQVVTTAATITTIIVASSGTNKRLENLGNRINDVIADLRRH